MFQALYFIRQGVLSRTLLLATTTAGPVLLLYIEPNPCLQHYDLVDEKEMAPLQELIEKLTGGVIP